MHEVEVRQSCPGLPGGERGSGPGAGPEWLSFALWVFLSSAWFITSALLNHPKILSVVVSFYLVIGIGAFAAYYRHSIVYMRYSHEGGAKKWVEKHGSSIIIANPQCWSRHSS
jgi:hypothetical protein